MVDYTNLPTQTETNLKNGYLAFVAIMSTDVQPSDSGYTIINVDTIFTITSVRLQWNY